MKWLRSRWVIVPAGLLATVALWNIYVAANAGGIVEGQVVDRAGVPVPGATVLLYERSFITNNEKQRTVTGADGHFRFEGNASHAVQLQAEGAGGRSERMTVRLWFRAQNRQIAEPLRLTGTSS